MVFARISARPMDLLTNYPPSHDIQFFSGDFSFFLISVREIERRVRREFFRRRRRNREAVEVETPAWVSVGNF